jgi:hypothetical protein
LIFMSGHSWGPQSAALSRLSRLILRDGQSVGDTLIAGGLA